MWGLADARGDSGLVDWRDKNAQGGKEAGDEMAVRSRTIRNAGHQGMAGYRTSVVRRISKMGWGHARCV